MIPVPAESVEEFRVGTTNPNATFGRSAGGQVALVTKRGTNELHGSAYWYHQNDNLSANRVS
jgi:putative hemolysin